MKCRVYPRDGVFDVYLVGLGSTGMGERKILELDFYPQVVVICPFCKGMTAANNDPDNGPCAVVHTDPTCKEWRDVPQDDPATFLEKVNNRLRQDTH